MRCLNGKRTQAIGFKTEILDGQELKKTLQKYSTVIIIIDVFIPVCKYNN